MVRISSESKSKEHFAKRVDRPSGEQSTKQWQSRIAAEEKATYSGRMRSKSNATPIAVNAFVEKLRGALLQIVHAKGGTEFSILRHTFLDWDADRSGELGIGEFRNAMATLGVKSSDDEYNAVIDHFDVEGDGEMRYEPLVNEVVKGTSHWLHHPSTADVKERRFKNDTGGEIVNLDLAKAVLRNSPDVKRSYGMTSPSARSSISSMSRQKLLDSARKSARESAKGGMSGRSGLSGRSGKTDRSSGSAGATAIRLLQEQLGDERKRREKAEKELEELRATERKGGEEKGEEEELRKFRNFKASGGIIDP